MIFVIKADKNRNRRSRAAILLAACSKTAFLIIGRQSHKYVKMRGDAPSLKLRRTKCAYVRMCRCADVGRCVDMQMCEDARMCSDVGIYLVPGQFCLYYMIISDLSRDAGFTSGYSELLYLNIFQSARPRIRTSFLNQPVVYRPHNSFRPGVDFQLFVYTPDVRAYGINRDIMFFGNHFIG